MRRTQDLWVFWSHVSFFHDFLVCVYHSNAPVQAGTLNSTETNVYAIWHIVYIFISSIYFNTFAQEAAVPQQKITSVLEESPEKVCCSAAFWQKNLTCLKYSMFLALSGHETYKGYKGRYCISRYCILSVHIFAETAFREAEPKTSGARLAEITRRTRRCVTGLAASAFVCHLYRM